MKHPHKSCSLAEDDEEILRMEAMQGEIILSDLVVVLEKTTHVGEGESRPCAHHQGGESDLRQCVVLHLKLHGPRDGSRHLCGPAIGVATRERRRRRVED